MKEVLSLIAIYAGVFLMFVASLGLFRMPDAYTRMSAVTKAVTFKIGLVMLGVCIFFNTLPIIIKAILIVLFLLLTTPVSSHLIAREAYLLKVPMWKKMLLDEFGKHMDRQSGKEGRQGAGEDRRKPPSDNRK